MKFKKLVALLLAGVMMFAPATVLAEENSQEGNLSGDAVVEGVVEKNVFDVKLPVVQSTDTTFDFVLDPQGLIAASIESGAAKGDYSGQTITDSLLFTNTDDDGNKTYTGTSNKLVAYNYGTVKVDVTVTATATPANGAVFTTDKTFADDTTSSVYLAIVGVESNEVAIDSSNKATAKAELAGVEDTNFEVTYDTGTNKYSYTLKSDYDKETAPNVEFGLTGKCNTNGVWTGNETATVDVVWTLAEHKDTPPTPTYGFAEASYTYVKGQELQITATPETEDATIVALAYKMTSEGDWTNFTANTDYTVDGNTITIPANSGACYSSASETPLNVILGVAYSDGKIYETSFAITQE